MQESWANGVPKVEYNSVDQRKGPSLGRDRALCSASCSHPYLFILHVLINGYNA